MKIPEFRFIITFIASKNKFTPFYEIVDNQTVFTGKPKWSVKSYVYSALNRLEKRGILIFIQTKDQNIKMWGFPHWIDNNGNPLKNHMPVNKTHIIVPSILRVNPRKKH